MTARLIITAGEGAPTSCDLSSGQSAWLGRNRSSTIVLKDQHSSRRHAEVYCREDRWFIRDCSTINGTKINGERIQAPSALRHGYEIAIGNIRLLFVQLSGEKDGAATAPERSKIGNGAEPCGAELKTVLQADELSSLCLFMSSAVGESSPLALVEHALDTVHQQTAAAITGFLSLDPENPLPKLVLPELASVDIHLSRQLTQLAQSHGKLVRLRPQDQKSSESDSLLSFTDALCVPLKASGVDLGALHVYKSGETFSDREERFCEVLGGYLANSLQLLRSRSVLAAENSRLRAHSTGGADEIVGASAALRKVREQIARLAPGPATVLIVGESGVGKELVAMALHRQSPRSTGPLVTVNCASIPANLAEAELFGHRAGAFTDARGDRPGFFEQADEGTLFLDEIGELSLDCQAKLLRAMDSKGFRPVGGTSDVRVDVRVLAATHRNLDEMVRAGKFRQDLYFRLSVKIKVPPLRERCEDIPQLVNYYLPTLSLNYRRPLQLTSAAMDRLRKHPWPGNVRQLRAVLESAVAMSDGPTLDAADLPLTEPGGATSEQPPDSLNLEQLEIWAIRQALRQTHGNVSAAAEILGIHRDTLGLKMKKYGLKRIE
jgi:DNA-binding NtrC family response regulator